MIDLYTWPTPNGHKVHIMLEECALPYKVHAINIGAGDQFKPDFLKISPNNKMPAIVDHDGPDGKPLSLFESGAILLYLAEKFGAFLPTAGAARAECLSWLFWQMGSAPFVGGGFGHFYKYAPIKVEYAIDRYTMETKRQLDVLDQHLAHHEYLAGSEYTIADMAAWPWYGEIVRGAVYDAAEFLDTASYRNVGRWAATIAARPAVQRGRRVNRITGDPALQLRERHSAADFDR